MDTVVGERETFEFLKELSRYKENPFLNEIYPSGKNIVINAIIFDYYEIHAYYRHILFRIRPDGRIDSTFNSGNIMELFYPYDILSCDNRIIIGDSYDWIMSHNFSRKGNYEDRDFNNIFGSYFQVSCYYNHTEPLKQAHDISFDHTRQKISWKRGNGEKVAVFLKSGTSGYAKPRYGIHYSANNDWDIKGSQIDTTRWFCIYSGSDSSIIIRNLNPDSLYRAMVLEYNGKPHGEMYNIDNANKNPVNIDPKVSTVNIHERIVNNSFTKEFILYPNPAKNTLTIHCKEKNNHIQIFNCIGYNLLNMFKKEEMFTIDISHLKVGIYIIKIIDQDKTTSTSFFIKR